jgi:prepilin-type N-terminal cleavage/methylation domain-containing protein
MFTLSFLQVLIYQIYNMKKLSVNSEIFNKTSKSGFTLLEMLLVIAIIAILASIVVVAINPAKQIGDANDAQRRSDVLAILNAINQYMIDNDGDISALSIESDGDCEISDTDAEWICVEDGCGENGQLYTELVESGNYLTEIPIDPLTAASETPVGGDDSSGYRVAQNTTTNRVTVCAPWTQQNGGTEISVTR